MKHGLWLFLALLFIHTADVAQAEEHYNYGTLRWEKITVGKDGVKISTPIISPKDKCPKEHRACLETSSLDYNYNYWTEIPDWSLAIPECFPVCSGYFQGYFQAKRLYRTATFEALRSRRQKGSPVCV